MDSLNRLLLKLTFPQIVVLGLVLGAVAAIIFLRQTKRVLITETQIEEKTINEYEDAVEEEIKEPEEPEKPEEQKKTD